MVNLFIDIYNNYIKSYSLDDFWLIDVLDS